MIRFRCGRCTEWLGAADSESGRAVQCHQCGHLNLCPERAPIGLLSSAPVRPAAPTSWVWMWLAGGVVVLAVLAFWNGVGSWGAIPTSSLPASPAEARQQALLKQNIDLPGEPDLVRAYQAINVRHFAGALPSIAVRWEPALADVGALASQAFTLEGMFGRIGKKLIILLNPSVKADRRAFDRALCHEMAHLFLFTTGDPTTNHGPAFRSVLERLANEGGFEGVAGSDVEKAELRAWIDTESARIDVDRQDLEIVGREIARSRDELDAELQALKTRLATEEAGRGRLSTEEVQSVEARRERFNQLVADANARIERGRAALAHFNAEVARYNLMMVYPDGIDEDALALAKPVMHGATGR